jgi:hypothetical protein
MAGGGHDNRPSLAAPPTWPDGSPERPMAPPSAALAAPASVSAPAQATPDARPRPARPLLVLTLAGTQAEMGRQHGLLLREVGGYEPVLEYYPRMLDIFVGGERGGVPEVLLRPFVAWALRRLERGRPRDLHERTLAFFEALGYPANHARNLFVMDLLQNVVGLAGRLGAVGPSRRLMTSCAVPACSSAAVWGSASRDGTMRHARNFDFPGAGLWEQGPTVVFCRPETGLRYGFVTTRGADVPGVTVWNEAGITLGTHTRFHKDVSFSGRGIVDLAHEIGRKAETLADAERIAREVPAASTWGILVSSAREQSAVVLEITSRQVEVVRPRADHDWLAQTNRYRSESLKAREVAPSAGHIANSDGRYRSVKACVAAGTARSAARGGIDVLDLQAMLGSNGDPEQQGYERAGGGVLAQGISVQSVVVEPQLGRVHVSVGPCPTGHGPYVVVDHAWDAPVGKRVIEPSTHERSITTEYSQGPRARGHARFMEAVAQEGQGKPRLEVLAAVEAAVAEDGDEPTYRLIAGALRLNRDDMAGALAHFRAGLAHERTPFHRGQLLIWGSRAADVCGEGDLARAMRAELLRLEHPLVSDYQREARAEASSPITRRALRRARVNMVFPDVTW